MNFGKDVSEKTSESLSYQPKTSLGKSLLEIRKKIIASGEQMLNWEEIEKEISDRRGGHENQTL